jgi:nucleotide-binding universal stress UspA family protein
MKLLLPVDGSDTSLHAVTHVLAAIAQYKAPPELYLLNVQPPLSGGVTMFIRGEQVKQFHQEEGAKALAAARSKLDTAKVAYRLEIKVGEPGETIAGYAKEIGADEICMGTRGLAHVTGMLLGSVATKVIHLVDIPVLLVK